MLFAVFLTIWAQFSSALEENEWDSYKNKHGKNYSSVSEETKRRLAFERSRQLISVHNEGTPNGTHSYDLALNHLADIDRRSPLASRGLGGLLESKHEPLQVLRTIEVPDEKIPPTLDWRKKGYDSTPPDQESCGSCYAFTLASAVEAQVFKNNGSVPKLSEQQLVDCTILFGNLGCSGGSLRNTAKYLQRYGLLPEEKYPYKGKQTLCKPVTLLKKEGIPVKKWGVLPRDDEEILKKAVATLGPIAVSINANPHTFQLYHSGVYDDPNCNSNSINHAMLLVGYTEDSWILKNWWTPKWGQEGYMHLKRGKNRCGVASYSVYVTLE